MVTRRSRWLAEEKWGLRSRQAILWSFAVGMFLTIYSCRHGNEIRLSKNTPHFDYWLWHNRGHNFGLSKKIGKKKVGLAVGYGEKWMGCY